MVFGGPFQPKAFYNSMKLSPLNSWKLRWELEEVIKTMGRVRCSECGEPFWTVFAAVGTSFFRLSDPGEDQHPQNVVRPTLNMSIVTEWTTFRVLVSFHWEETQKNLLRPDVWLVQEAKGICKGICWQLMTISPVLMNSWFSSGRKVSLSIFQQAANIS